jgi:hypothetical protein
MSTMLIWLSTLAFVAAMFGARSVASILSSAHTQPTSRTAIIAPGDVNGQGLNDYGASWVAVSPDGNASSGSTSSSAGGFGGY